MKLPILIGAASLAAFGALTPAQAEKRPNVLFIIVDDSEKVEYGCYGGDTLTPHIDSIASDGVLFHQGFTSSSVCTPTRYTCLTGQYASRAESLRTEDQQPEDMPTFVRWNTHLQEGGNNVASVLRANGYVTGIIGKWHIGHSPEYAERVANIPGVQYVTENTAVAKGDPIGDRVMHGGEAFELTDPDFNRYLRAKYEIAVDDIKKNYGYDEVLRFYSGNLTDYPKSMRKFYQHNQDWMTEGALEFLDTYVEGEKPFFLYFSTTLQHGPEPVNSIEADRRITAKGYIDEAPDVQPDYKSIYKRLDAAGLPRSRAPFVWFDDGVGAVIQKLKDEGVYDNTLIFFYSDQQSWGKGSCYDGGVCTPYIMSWPKSVPDHQVSNELVSNIDFAPTIFDACGITAPKDMHIDGLSILPAVTGEKEALRDELFFELGDMRAVRTKDYKYITVRRPSDEEWAKLPKKIQEEQAYRRRYFNLGYEWKRWSGAQHLMNSRVAMWRDCHSRFAGDPDQLFDLRIDPSENVNFYGNAEYKHIQKDMRKRLKAWLQTMPGPYAEFKK